MKLVHRQSFRVLASLLAACLLGACQSTLYLMPTPAAFRTGEVSPFESTPEWERNLTIPVAYATNRLPANDLDRNGYSRQFDDSLRLGITRIFVGDDPDARWEDLDAISTIEERPEDVPLRLHQVTEYFELSPEMKADVGAAKVEELFTALNELLAEHEDPDLLIFVHGANNNFYRSTAQAAQYRHFSGRHTVVLAFVWPSMENILRYGADVRNAMAAAPLLAQLIELTATRSNARYINLMAYSLGAKVVTSALEELRNNNRDEDPAELKARLRIGEVYFAAADVDFQRFVQQLQSYKDIVGRVSLTVNMDDSALGFSAFVAGVSRAGRPDTDELTAEESRWLIEASRTENFDVIEVGTAVAPYAAFSAHDYWYSNPRVSTDIIIQMLSQAPPAERGLARYETDDGYEVWYFPEDYPERSISAVQELRARAP
ncbi:MAG: alpha/beta hydrolase [Gammaproteobacteria bacterium]|nr:alpha/beta hydrolase [Gammaproteobacteria bacterium]